MKRGTHYGAIFWACCLGLVLQIVALSATDQPKSGGAKSKPPPVIPEAMRKRVAVMPLEDGALHRADWWGPDWRVGAGISDMMTTAMAKTKLFRMIEREQLDKVLAEQKLGQQGILDTGTAAKVGKVLGVQYIITGKVTEFSADTKGGVVGSVFHGWGGVGATLTTAKVAIDCRLVDTTTAEIMLPVTGRGSESRPGAAIHLSDFGHVSFGSINFMNTVLGRATRKAVEGCVKQLAEETLAPDSKIMGTGRYLSGLVVNFDPQGGLVMINLGERSGVRQGDVFEIAHKVKEIKDPETGEVLDTITQKIGEVTIIEVKEKVSQGALRLEPGLGAQGGVAEGDLAKLKVKAEQTKPAPVEIKKEQT